MIKTRWLMALVVVLMAGCAMDDFPEDDELPPDEPLAELYGALVSGCDKDGQTGWWQTVYSGASFEAYDRAVMLRNESLFDTYSKGEMVRARRGDRLWIDRSLNRVRGRAGETFAGNDRVNAAGGWRMCGPFVHNGPGPSFVQTQLVRNDGYAVRVCNDPVDAPYKCGEWYLDANH